MLKRLLPLFSVCLVACGGTSGTSSPYSQLPGLDVLQATSTQQFEQLLVLDFTPLTDIPTRGTATYTGVLEARLETITRGNLDFIGPLELGLDFEDAGVIITGGVSQGYEMQGTELSGELTLASSAYERFGDPNVDRTLSFGMGGELVDSEGARFDILIRFEGDFFGDDHRYVGGVALGRVEDIDGVGTINGRFTASTQNQ